MKNYPIGSSGVPGDTHERSLQQVVIRSPPPLVELSFRTSGACGFKKESYSISSLSIVAKEAKLRYFSSKELDFKGCEAKEAQQVTKESDLRFRRKGELSWDESLNGRGSKGELLD